MSWEATGYVKKIKIGLSVNEKFVLMILADYHRTRERSAWPSSQTLAEDCLMTKRGVQQILARLEENGFIVKTSGCGRGNVNGYKIVGLDVEEETSSDNVLSEQQSKHKITGDEAFQKVHGETSNGDAQKVNARAAKGERPCSTMRSGSIEVKRSRGSLFLLLTPPQMLPARRFAIVATLDCTEAH
jgi:Helix-turn-helix domain